MIKNIEDLKKCQIVCRNDKDIEDCLNMLEELDFEVRNNDNQYQVIFYRQYGDFFENDDRLECGVDTYFYNRKFIKILQKFKKEKEKEQQTDFEVASDGRILKINNKGSKKCLYFIGAWDYGTINFDYFEKEGFEYYIKLGLSYSTEEARDRAQFKMEIETKLKNIAERLNNGVKIDWNNERQPKFNINYDFIDHKKMYCNVNHHYKSQGAIYCLDENFLNVAKQEIGEEKLIKYFTE